MMGDLRSVGSWHSASIRSHTESCSFLPLGWLGPQNMRLWQLAAVFTLFVAATILAFILTLTIGLTESVTAEHAFPFAVAVFGSATIVLFWLLGSVVQRSALLQHIAIYLGRISYAVYLFHLLFLIIGADFFRSVSGLLALTIYLVALTAFCTVFYYVFERPSLPRGHLLS
jgi:peptidoglycan/LPS O-acetylase OafA/YrhL